MMRCSKAQIWLQGYVDGELTPKQMKRVRSHVDRCPDCAKMLEGLSKLKTLLAENRPQPLIESTPEFFWSQVKARIQGDAKPRQSWSARFEIDWFRIVGLATACLAIGLLAGWVWIRAVPKSADVLVSRPPRATIVQVEKVEAGAPNLYATAYRSPESKATIIWTEGMPLISLEL